MADQQASAGKHRYIKRHDLYMRITHWAFAVCGVILGITGLLLFVPPIGHALNIDVIKFGKIMHRVFGVIFIVVPVVCAIIRPSNVVHTFKNLFRRWDQDDKDFMKKFIPYLFNPKKYHMPKQHFIKSGQRLADIAMYLCIIFIAITGVVLWLGGSSLPTWLFSLALFGHDLCFFGMAVIFVIHVYLGAGIFQPYRRSANFMFGDGYAHESDALYHWGWWAEEELDSGENVIEK